MGLEYLLKVDYIVGEDIIKLVEVLKARIKDFFEGKWVLISGVTGFLLG